MDHQSAQEVHLRVATAADIIRSILRPITKPIQRIVLKVVKMRRRRRRQNAYMKKWLTDPSSAQHSEHTARAQSPSANTIIWACRMILEDGW